MRDHSELTLRNQRDFSRVYNQGKSKGGKYAVILYRRNGLKISRTAFVSSKKVGNSVERNRSRRLMRTAYKAIESEIRSGFDIIFIARNAIKGCKEQEVEKQIIRSLKGSGLLKDSNISNEKK